MENNCYKVVLLIGGARSGKSTYAQKLAEQMGGSILFCATAEPLDDEMAARIEAHRKLRPLTWETLEAGKNIGALLHKRVPGHNSVIIDCITILIANCLGSGDSQEDPARADDEISMLINIISQRHANFIVVTNEVGNGLVPDNKLGRLYRDALGQANQRLAICADDVYLMVAGLPVKIK
jgi:adenosylcobinamide kinase / adenosylcobinamide-phosphate guanylyltransferase